MLKKESLPFWKKENQNGKISEIKKYYNYNSNSFWTFFIFLFRDHNFKRAIDACIAGSQKLEKPMTIKEAQKFCEDQIMGKK